MRSIVGPETKLDGTWQGRGDLELRGAFRGSCKLEGGLFLFGGKLEGQCAAIVLDMRGGHLEGRAVCSESIHLKDRSRIEGQVRAPMVDCNDDCSIVGSVDLG